VAVRRATTQSPGSRSPRGVFLLMIATVSVAWLENGLTLYLPLLMIGRGLPLAAASRVLFAYSAAAAGGVLTGGALSDRVPRWRVMVLALALSAPLYAGTLLLSGGASLALAACLGYASALSHPTSVAMAQEMMPDRTSLAAALTMGISWVQGSLGAALTGVLADRIGVQQALLLNGVLPAVGIVGMVAVYRVGRRGAALASNS
jgi:predicted MFS family arabinose efflux permease